MATLTAIDLKESGVSTMKLFNFGSPRVGNTAFAEWASSYLTDRNRVTHYKDMVPHVPMHERFTHISGKTRGEKRLCSKMLLNSILICTAYFTC